jgi:cellulose synthase/poly-beta-1,6-N-acetylglucosamine synthase-like glycosyltransferase
MIIKIIENILLIILITLILIHFGLPSLYYLYMMRKSENYVKANTNNYPLISIIIPTYNEEKTIKNKILNILNQNYPKDKIEIIVVDSGSKDKTIDIAKEFNVKILKQEERKGKANALNYALNYAKGEIIVVTDSDSFWKEDALKKGVEILNNEKVGAVTCIKEAYDEKIEKTYRDLYNVIRLGESSIFSTPIAHGEFFAFKRNCLDKFSEEVGADDSNASHKISLNGFRSIAVKDIVCKELIPKKGYIHWRIRRAKHLIQHFNLIKKDLKKVKNKDYKKILYYEIFLHLINPWFLLFSIIIALTLSLLGNIISIILLIFFLITLLSKTVRTWVLTQFFLIYAQISNNFNKEIIWEKEEK